MIKKKDSKKYLNLKAEDPVFIICKGTNTEPAPKPIDIIFICKRW